MEKRLLCSLLAFALLGCTGGSVPSVSASVKEEETEVRRTERRILTVYFSTTGHTEQIAETAADLLSSDCYEIVPEQAYTDDDLDYGVAFSRTSLEQKDSSARPAIASEAISLEEYDTILLGYPIWWAEAPKILYTFLEGQDLSGKEILPFCTSASSPSGNSAQHLQEAAGKGEWHECHRFAIGTGHEEITAWLKEEGLWKENTTMILKINDREIPVLWEDNRSVQALREKAEEGITVPLSMYAGNEQFGSLGSDFPSDDVRITSSCGDIMLYMGNQIVLFYGSNTWKYTRLGRMELSEEEITELLSKGDVRIALTADKGDEQ